MSSNKIIPTMLNLHSGKHNVMKGILGPLSRGHHQFGVTAKAVPRSNSQAGSLAPSGSFLIRRMVKLGLVTYPQRCLLFTCEVSRSRTFSSIAENVKPENNPSSEILERLATPEATSSSTEGKPEDFDVGQLATVKRAIKRVSHKSLEDLLKKHPKDRDAERIEEILKELEGTGYKFNPNILQLLIFHFCNHDNLERALHYKNLLHSENPKFHIGDSLLVNVATLFASRGQFEETEKLISEHSPHDAIEDTKSNLSFNVYNLLSAIGSSGGTERAQKMLDLLTKKGYYRGNPPNAHLSAIVKIHIEKNDIDGAVKQFLQAVEMYRCTPCQNLLFQTLIEKSETDRLQTVMDAASKVHRESNVLASLTLSLFKVNRSAQALKLLKSSGLMMTERGLHEILTFLVDAKQNEVLEELINMGTNIFDVNRDLVYYHLIRACVLEENVKKASEVWSIMQEEGVKPSKYTLHLLGNFLTQMGQPVSFSFPKTAGEYTFKEATKKEGAKKENAKKENARKEDRKTEQFARVKNLSLQLENFLNEDKLTDAKKVLDDLVSDNKHPTYPVLKKYLQKLSDIGDIKTLSYLEQKLPASVLEQHKFQNHKALVKINLGLSEELMKDWEDNPTKDKVIPAKAFMTLLTNHPENFERLKRVADLHYEVGNPKTRNFVWIWLMKNQKISQANDIFKSTPEFNKKLLFSDITDAAKNNKNEAISQALLEQMKSTELRNSAKGYAYSAHIDVLISVSKLDEALKTFEESQKSLGLSDIRYPTLESLKSELTSKGKPVPFTLPEVDESSKTNRFSNARKSQA